MKFSRAALFAACVSVAVFAQDGEEFEQFQEIGNLSSGGSGYSAPSAPAYSSSSYSSYSSSNNEKKSSAPKLTFSGDIFLNPGFEFDNDYDISSTNNGGEIREDDRSNAFNVSYAWNVLLGVEFSEKFSVNFRLSNPSGYDNDNLAFSNGSAKGYIPTLPNAYFTWKQASIFSLSGGLLNVENSTVLDLVAGSEAIDYDRVAYYGLGDNGLWTSYSGWACKYNNSQAGLKFGFDFTDDFSFNLMTALVSPTNTLDDYPIYNEFRFILDANIGLGDLVTLSPVIQTRSYWGHYRDYINNKRKASILLAYGTDVFFDFNDVFNLNAGIAFGNIRLNKSYRIDYYDGYSQFYGADETAFGFLASIAPSLNFGINEVAFSYSLGAGNFRTKTEYNDNKYSFVCNDLYLGWYFRANENIAFGPAVAMAFRTDKSSYKDYGSGITTKSNDGGYNNIRFGIEFLASF